MEQQIFPVDMICLCNANGDIQPLRFRMEDEKHQLVRVDIDEVVSCKKIQYVQKLHILPMMVRNIRQIFIISMQSFLLAIE
jgi:hypothetical protein